MRIPKEPVEHCECVCVHTDIVNSVTAELPKEEDLYDLAELFKVFGILPEFVFYMLCLSMRCVYVI